MEEVKGNRSIHSIISIGEFITVLMFANCHVTVKNHCIVGDYSEREDKEQVDDWEIIEIQPEKGKRRHPRTAGRH